MGCGFPKLFFFVLVLFFRRHNIFDAQKDYVGENRIPAYRIFSNTGSKYRIAIVTMYVNEKIRDYYAHIVCIVVTEARRI